MWKQACIKKTFKGLIALLGVICIFQIGFTMIYLSSSSGNSVYKTDNIGYDPSFVTWLRNASLNDLRYMIAKQIDPIGFLDFNEVGKSTRASACQPPWTEPDGSLNLTTDTTEYFKQVANLSCLQDGTNFLVPIGNLTSCPCLPGWSGISCSIPDSVRYSNYPFKTEGEPRIRKIPRRIVQAIPFNIEFEMLEARFAEVGDVVDAFMVLESNFSAYGDPKPLRLLDRLKAGYYADVACKIIHVFLNFFPKGAKADGWIADNIHRDFIASHGVARQLKNYRLDDVFFLSDADELVTRENLLFLKLHDGWPEPVGFNLQRNAYGFFWRPKPEPVHIIGGVTFGVLTRVLNNKAISIRSGPAYLKKQARQIQIYKKAYPRSQKINMLWSFGNRTHPAGFHCSWCCPAECMRIKLVSAQNGDFPRWGDYPAKRNITYIKGLIQRGLWFDNVGSFKQGNEAHPFYAPKSILANRERYEHIIVNPYSNVSHFLTNEDIAANTRSVQDYHKKRTVQGRPIPKPKPVIRTINNRAKENKTMTKVIQQRDQP